MATSQFLNHSDRQVRRSIDTSYGGGSGGSTTHLCLKKIINIITTHSSSSSVEVIHPSEIAKTSTSMNKKFGEKSSSRDSSCRGKRGFDIDLNLRLGPALDSEANQAENGGFSACSSVGDAFRFCGIEAKNGGDSAVEKSSVGECDAKETLNSSGDFSAMEAHKGEEREVVEDETKELSEITNPRVQSSEIEAEEAEQINEIEEIEEKEKKVERGNRDCRSDGYLGLLVEAARLVSGNFEDEDEDEEAGSDQPIQNNRTREESGKRNHRWWTLEICEDLEDISPVVRSKRGRNQVLPFRYRDSVLEPLKRLSRNHRPSPRVSAKPRTNR